MGKKSIKEKTSITLYVEAESYELVKDFGDRSGIGVSNLVDMYLQTIAKTIKMAKADHKGPVTKVDALRIVLKGAFQAP